MSLKLFVRAALVSALLGTTAPAAAQPSEAIVTPAQNGLNIGVGKGTLVALPRAMTDVFVANQAVADVQVRTDRMLYIFGTGAGETSIYATDGDGDVVYSANVRVAQNIDQIRTMLGMAMPGAAIDVTAMNGMTLLSGTVASPAEVEEATRLVTAFLGEGQVVVNKLKTAMPQQVNLRVQFAEVSREVLKALSSNLEILGNEGFLFGIARGRDAITIDDDDITNFIRPAEGTGFSFLDRFGGSDVGAVIDALEQDGLISLLAEPNLTALSGETASFLAGGEFPIAVSDGLGNVSVEFKEYGVGLAFTPTVLDDNRISMRVRPEVSELSEAGAIRLDNISIPALTTRRAETTVELGSGQSFVIGGLLRNRFNTSVERVPLLGRIPILGALFKSDRYQRNETELVIVITPYLVRPANQRMALPTDGLRPSTDSERMFLGHTHGKAATPPATAHAKTPATAPAAEAVAAPGFSMK